MNRLGLKSGASFDVLASHIRCQIDHLRALIELIETRSHLEDDYLAATLRHVEREIRQLRREINP